MIPETETPAIKEMAMRILPKILEYYKDPKNMQAFQEWRAKKEREIEE